MNEKDEILYNRFHKEKDEEALLELIKRHRDSLALFICGFVHDMDMAQELTLDTFAEIAAGPTFFSGRSSFRTWLFSIGRNLALKYIRKQQRFRTLTGNEDTDTEESPGSSSSERSDLPEMEILKDERNRQLYDALSKINEDYRRILVLLYFEEMSVDEVSRIMGKNKKQIYNLADRGKKALKEELQRSGFEYEIDQ